MVVCLVYVVNAGSVFNILTNVDNIILVDVVNFVSLGDVFTLVDVVPWKKVVDSGSVVDVSPNDEAVPCVGVVDFSSLGDALPEDIGSRLNVDDSGSIVDVKWDVDFVVIADSVSNGEAYPLGVVLGDSDILVLSSDEVIESIVDVIIWGNVDESVSTSDVSSAVKDVVVGLLISGVIDVEIKVGLNVDDSFEIVKGSDDGVKSKVVKSVVWDDNASSCVDIAVSSCAYYVEKLFIVNLAWYVDDVDSFCVGFVVSIGLRSIDDTSFGNLEMVGFGDVISSCSKVNVVSTAFVDGEW